jgi:hypothetical protein
MCGLCWQLQPCCAPPPKSINAVPLDVFLAAYISLHILSAPACLYRRQLRYELDFRNEASNAARLAADMAGRADVAVPRIMPHLSTSRVLTMEWVEGCKVRCAH